MKRLIRITAGVVGCAIALLAVSIPADGQWDERHWRRLNKQQVERIIKNVEIGSDEYRRDFDRWLDDSRLDGSEREDRYNSRVRTFENAADKLRSEFDKKDRWWEVRDDVNATLNAARPVGEMMRSRRFPRNLEFQWNKLRKALNKLADTYRLRSLPA
jgi:hypothetical protein